MHSFKNNVHLEGNLGKDAEKTTTAKGDVVNFSIAVNEQWESRNGTEHKRTDWFNIQVWGPMTKFAATLKKGTPIIVEGKIVTGTYPDPNHEDVQHKAFSIRANSIRKIDWNEPSGADEQVGAEVPETDEIPF